MRHKMTSFTISTHSNSLERLVAKRNHVILVSFLFEFSFVGFSFWTFGFYLKVNTVCLIKGVLIRRHVSIPLEVIIVCVIQDGRKCQSSSVQT